MKFKRKASVIEAEQFRDGKHASRKRIPRGVCLKPCLDGDWIAPHVHTIHNGQTVLLQDRDWVIPEPDGTHFYPCKPDVFEATYESVT